MLYRESIQRSDGLRVEIALWRGKGALGYRLECRHGGRVLVRYARERRGGDTRTAFGRCAPYAFRSVEQLRYDFERELEALA
jgi:hypothetical protein